MGRSMEKTKHALAYTIKLKYLMERDYFRDQE
jgi:hypothetical protein